jgi:2,3-dihydroxybiphenyl 1,2-dioxygenase
MHPAGEAVEIRALGYAGVYARDLDPWVAFGGGLLGLQVAERTRSTLAFRMDDRAQRLVVQAGDSGGAAFFGWEVADGAALATLADRLENSGVRVDPLSAALASERRVRDGIGFRDPAGNRLEAFCDAAPAGEPFRPGRNISGFVTAAAGMGHVVLTVEHVETVMPFYRDVLGFRLSDFILKPFKAHFFHVNPRHHSLALIETGRNGVHHLMMELNNLDDVGQAYDLALGEDNRIGTTLGRHTNDFMISFYSRTPSDFLLEYGWGGRRIDPAAWRPVEMTGGPSLWGHERTWLHAQGRAEARAMRLRLAAEGVRAPVQVMSGNYVVSPKP